MFVLSVNNSVTKTNNHMKKRVKIPMQNVQELLALVKNARARHEADAESSPLKVLNWDVANSLINQAIATEERAQALKREKLNVFQQRSAQQKEMLKLVRSMRDVLTGVHNEEMKELGSWGFDVYEKRSSRQREETPVEMKM